MLMTLLAFIAALCILIAVHEYGHYKVAVLCGVKVERFSIGFGKPLWRYRPAHSDTEFVLAAIPLGGYVRMLDARNGDVAEHEAHRAFNNQPLKKRAAIVAAGPIANLLLAIALYSVVNWIGVEQPKAIVASPEVGTLAFDAGLRGGEEVYAIKVGDEQAAAIQSFDDLRWHITQALVEQSSVTLHWQKDGRQLSADLPLDKLSARNVGSAEWQRIGLTGPWTAPVLGQVLEQEAAARAGLQAGDHVVRVNDTPIEDAAQLRRLIQQAPASASGLVQQWLIQRDETLLQLSVHVQAAQHEGVSIGRVGAYIGTPAAQTVVRKGALEGVVDAARKTWEMSWLSVQMMVRMLMGQASLDNLSGPLTIADYAGKSAGQGWIAYVLFLALISVSLGVLNLLPLPVLDGGHLMYYLWEGVTGHPVSDVWMERLQRVGISLLLVMMSIAFFNDISRIWG
ncbi:MAG: RIP metalloprotease RseP [Comamonas sp.]